MTRPRAVTPQVPPATRGVRFYRDLDHYDEQACDQRFGRLVFDDDLQHVEAAHAPVSAGPDPRGVGSVRPNPTAPSGGTYPSSWPLLGAVAHFDVAPRSADTPSAA